MKKVIQTSILSTLAVFSSINANAAEATTEPVGGVTVSCLASSDTGISLTLSRPAEFVGSVLSVSSNVITLSGTPAWTVNQFFYQVGVQTNTYYVVFKSGAKEGCYYTVEANGVDTLTLELNGDDISSVVANDILQVIPYWTLGTVFPLSDAGVSFEVSPSTLVKKSQVTLKDANYAGVNPPVAGTYYFYNSAWRKVGASASTSFNDEVLYPDIPLFLRNSTLATSLTKTGTVQMQDLVVILNQSSSTQIDNLVALQRPTDVTLANSGLISSGSFVVSPSTLTKKDQLLVYDNTTLGINKSPSATYYYYNGAWRKVGQSASISFDNDAVFTSSNVVYIRKAVAATTQSVVWNSPSLY